MSRRLTSQGCSWLERVALRASAALRCPPPAWWKTMVSLRKIYGASFCGQRIFSNFKGVIRSLEPASGSHTLVFAIFDEAFLVAEFGEFMIRRALFGAGMEILRLLNIFVDLDSLFPDGDIGRMLIDPSSAIKIIDSVLVLVQGGMSVAAENACRLMVAGMGQRALGDLL